MSIWGLTQYTPPTLPSCPAAQLPSEHVRAIETRVCFVINSMGKNVWSEGYR